MENPIKMDDLGKHPIFGNTHMYTKIYIHEEKNALWGTYTRDVAVHGGEPGDGYMACVKGSVLVRGSQSILSRGKLVGFVDDISLGDCAIVQVRWRTMDLFCAKVRSWMPGVVVTLIAPWR